MISSQLKKLAHYEAKMKYYHDLIGGGKPLQLKSVTFNNIPTDLATIQLPVIPDDAILLDKLKAIHDYKNEKKDRYELYTMMSTNKVISPEKREKRRQDKLTEISKLEHKLKLYGENVKDSKLETEITNLKTEITNLKTEVSTLEDMVEFNNFNELYNITLNGTTYRFVIYHNLPDMFSLESGNIIYSYKIITE